MCPSSHEYHWLLQDPSGCPPRLHGRLHRSCPARLLAGCCEVNTPDKAAAGLLILNNPRALQDCSAGLPMETTYVRILPLHRIQIPEDFQSFLSQTPSVQPIQLLTHL